MKAFYNKQKLKVIQYRKHENFSNEAFIRTGKYLSCFCQILFVRFRSTVDNILQKHAPMKKRYVQENQASFINSKLHKEIMRRTYLRNNL